MLLYLLTLAAVARELNIRGMTEARVHLAAGLPLTWVGQQRERFLALLPELPHSVIGGRDTRLCASDLHDPDAIVAYPTREGTECVINGYAATVEKKKTGAAIPEGYVEVMEVLVTDNA